MGKCLLADICLNFTIAVTAIRTVTEENSSMPACAKGTKKASPLIFVYCQRAYGERLEKKIWCAGCMWCEGERAAALRNINLWLSALSDLT